MGVIRMAMNNNTHGQSRVTPRGDRRVRMLLRTHPNLVMFLTVVGAMSIVHMSTSAVMTAVVRSSGVAEELPTQAIFVVAGGAPRTGSTFIYNILRILMRLRDPNMVAGPEWMLAKLVPENYTTTPVYDRMQLLRSLGTSVLLKLHTLHQYEEFAGNNCTTSLGDEVDLLVTSHRDLRDETISAFKMFAKNRTVFEANPERFANLCRSMIRKRDSLINAAAIGNVPVVDIRYEGWKSGSVSELRSLVHELADALPWSYSRAEKYAVLMEAKRLRAPPASDAGSDALSEETLNRRIKWHLVNGMNARHISHEALDESFIARGRAIIENEPICKAWLQEKNYAI